MAPAGVRLPGWPPDRALLAMLACLATVTAQLSQYQAQPNQFSNLGTSMLWEAGDVAVFALQAGGEWSEQELGVGGDVGLVVLREAGLPAGTSFYVTDNGV